MSILSIASGRTTQVACLIFFLFNLTAAWINSLPEISEDPDRECIGIILDELTALLSAAGGKITELPQLLRLARSKYVFVNMAVQSIDGLRTVYSEHEVNDMRSNIRNEVYFDASSDRKELSELAGVYSSPETSRTLSGKGSSSTRSYRDKQVVRPEDLLEVTHAGDAILFAKDAGGFHRIKRCNYFSAPF